MFPKTWLSSIAIAFLAMAFVTFGLYDALHIPPGLRVWVTILVGIVVFVAGFLFLEQRTAVPLSLKR